MAASDTIPSTDVATLLQQQNAVLQRIATTLDTIASTLQAAQEQQAQARPARPTRQAQAPQRRVTA